MNNLPKEILYWEYDKDLVLEAWYYPVLKIIEVFYNKKLYDTIYLDQQVKARRLHYIEHKTLGRCQV